MCLISIIMPAFNAEKYISEAIESVLAQTYQNWELLIVNDGSTDSTQVIIDKYKNKSNRIKSFFQENGKQGKARNLAISKSCGIYLAFLDADDLWLPHKLENQINQMDELQADLIFSDSYIFYDNISSTMEKMHISEGYLKELNGIQSLMEGNLIPILSVLVKRETVLRVGMFSEDPLIANAEDYHLWLKIIMSGGILWGSSLIFSSYRVHRNSSTNSDKYANKQLPYVYYNLIELFPNYKYLIYKRLKQFFKYKNKFQVTNKKELAESIRLNCKFLKKDELTGLFLLCNYFFGIPRTRHYINRFVNA
jgi:teichuronic acid biosynthesis glycosyltransferase TuaG